MAHTSRTVKSCQSHTGCEKNVNFATTHNFANMASFGNLKAALDSPFQCDKNEPLYSIRSALYEKLT